MEEDVVNTLNFDDDTLSTFLALDAEITDRILYPRPDFPEIFLTNGFVGAKVLPSFNLDVRLVR